MTVENEWIRQTLRVWTTVGRKPDGPGSVSRAMPVVGSTEFLPSIWHRGVRRWADEHLYTFTQLFNGTDFKSFFPPTQ